MAVLNAAIRRVRLYAGRAVEALREWVRDRCEGLAAALAFNLLLAAAPLAGASLAIAAVIFGEPWVRGHMVPILVSWTGPEGAAMLRQQLTQLREVHPDSLVSLGVVGIIGLTLGASGFFRQLHDSLETIWDIRREPAGVWAQLRKRALGLYHTAISAIILIGGLAIAGFVWSITDAASAQRLPLPGVFLESAVAFSTFWLWVFFLLRSLLPVRLPRRTLICWAAFIAALHLVGRLVITWRVYSRSTADPSSAEALILLLLYIYYVSMVLLYGAELMRLSIQASIPAAATPHHEAVPPPDHPAA